MNLLYKIARLSSLLVQIGIRRPGDLKYLFGILTSFAEEIVDPEADVRPLPGLSLDELLNLAGGDLRLHMHAFAGIPASISPVEAYALSILLKISGAGKAFEFGTYKGVSTTQLALNLSEDGHIYTLDLPEDHPAYSLEISEIEERNLTTEKGKGVLIPASVRDRVTFLRSDSATFDESPYAGTMNFVFVDGAHSAEYVENDSAKGWKMLKLGGIMAWHDCTPPHRDVVRFLRRCPHHPKRISGTSLAFATKG